MLLRTGQDGAVQGLLVLTALPAALPATLPRQSQSACARACARACVCACIFDTSHAKEILRSLNRATAAGFTCTLLQARVCSSSHPRYVEGPQLPTHTKYRESGPSRMRQVLLQLLRTVIIIIVIMTVVLSRGCRQMLRHLLMTAFSSSPRRGMAGRVSACTFR